MINNNVNVGYKLFVQFAYKTDLELYSLNVSALLCQTNFALDVPEVNMRWTPSSLFT